MSKVIVDKAKCIGCGTCTVLAPKSFQMAGDGRAEAIEPPGDEEAKINEVIASCPVGAISRQE